MQPDAQFKEVIRLISEANLAQAEAVCLELLASDPADINLSALLGAILLKGDRLGEAESILLDVTRTAPTFAKPHQDLAILYVNRKEYLAAAKYFRLATEIDPQLSAAFSGLSHVLDRLGDDRAASEARDRYLALTPANTLERVIALHHKGDLKNARIECGRLLAEQPESLGAMRRLALITADQGYFKEAERMFLRVNSLAPDSIVAIMDLANLYLDQHDYVVAIKWLQQAIEREPQDPGMHIKLAQAQLRIGYGREALAEYLVCLSLNPGDTQAMLGRGNALRIVGRGDEAIVAYQQCLDEPAIFADACWSLSSMRTYAFSDDQLQAMIEQDDREDKTRHAATLLDFAIGKALDDRGQYDGAWQRYVAANSRQREETHYDGAEFESYIGSLVSVYDEKLVTRGQRLESTDAIPIFIVGMPRSGSTLLEQILASHPQVEATAELPYLREIATPLNTRSLDSFPIIEIDGDGLRLLGEKYLEATAIHRPEQRPWFVDKLPANFPYVGFIHKILPQAVIIDARRHPVDTCVANFRQLFPQGKEFSYDLFELSEMYRQYLRMMAHWESVLPGKVLTVHYENVVADTETQVRGLLAHCGLEWDNACLDFSQTKRTFSTASSEQVQQPIYNESVSFWRHYEKHLAELIESLTPEG